MPKRKSISKRQRAIPSKPRHPAVLKQLEDDVKKVVSVNVTVGERELKFARALADTEERVRAASLASLRAWLKTHASVLDDLHLDQLWKALFYCIWMADKRPRISAVIRDIIALEDILGNSHIRALYRCLVREWLGIDKHRVDKFYELINVTLEMCASRITDVESEDDLQSKIDEFLLCINVELISKINRGGKGILMHVLDKWVDVVLTPVLAKAVSFSQKSLHLTWNHLLDPFLILLKSPDGRYDAVKIRFEERVLIKLSEVLASETIQIDKRSQHDMLDLVSKALFKVAAESQISSESRKRLYDIRTDLKIALSNLKQEADEDSKVQTE